MPDDSIGSGPGAHAASVGASSDANSVLAEGVSTGGGMAVGSDIDVASGIGGYEGP